MEGFESVKEKYGIPYQEPKTMVEVLANYQWIITICQYEIARLTTKSK